MENNSRSRLYASFHIAGFQYWDGALVLDRLKVGKALELVLEPGNPYDPDAVALYNEGSKLGFVPRELNGNLAQLLAFGHTGVFEARVQQVAPSAARGTRSAWASSWWMHGKGRGLRAPADSAKRTRPRFVTRWKYR